MAICMNCMGRGHVECPECDGKGRRWPESMSHGVLKDLNSDCYECRGSGRVPCEECEGTGYVDD